MASPQHTAPRIRRPDVEGLRAIASLLVAIYHVWPGRVSGGVDVFFVVAGFVLVPPLVAALADRGPRAAASSIRKAIVRQLPLAGLVLGAIAIAALTLWPSHLRRGILLDVLSAATWTMNWRLVDRSTDYLQQTATASPVQHLWATSVQLQATIVLVAVVLIAALVGARASARRRTLVALGVVTAASFAWAQVHVVLAPDAAYFDTAARVWEAAVGALAGLLAPSLRVARTRRTISTSRRASTPTDNLTEISEAGPRARYTFSAAAVVSASEALSPT